MAPKNKVVHARRLIFAVCFAIDYSGMSYGPEVAGFAIEHGVHIVSVMLHGIDVETTGRSLRDLKERGIKVVISLLMPLEQFEVFPVADELGLFAPEYTWLGATIGFSNPKAMVNRSHNPAQMARLLTNGLVFNHYPKSTYGSTELGRHASARGVEELFAVFPADLNSTISDGLEQPFVHSAVLHSYDLIWMLAKGHAETSSAGYSGSASYADRFIAGVTADSFQLQGITGLIQLDAHRGRRVIDGQYEFRIHQITSNSTLKLLGTLDKDGNFMLGDETPSFQWADGSWYPESIPFDGAVRAKSASIVPLIALAAVGTLLAALVVALVVKYLRMSSRLKLLEVGEEEEDPFRLEFQTPVTEAADVLKAVSASYRVHAALRKRAWSASQQLLKSRDLHAPLLDDVEPGSPAAMRLREAARHFAGQYTSTAVDSATSRDLEQLARQNAGSGVGSSSRRESELVDNSELASLHELMSNFATARPDLMDGLGRNICIDGLDIAAACGNQPLVLTTMTVLKGFGLVESLRLNELKLLKYLKHIEAGYVETNPYHNNIHAADVVNRLAYIVHAEGFFSDGTLTSKVYLLSAILAAAVHDYGHPGMNNDYEVSFDTPVSRQYNEQAVLEMQSVFVALEALRTEEGLNFMSHLSRPLQRSVMSRIIQLVLATDMKRHFAIVGEFKSQIVQRNVGQGSSSKQPDDVPSGRAGFRNRRTTYNTTQDLQHQRQPDGSPSHINSHRTYGGELHFHTEKVLPVNHRSRPASIDATREKPSLFDTWTDSDKATVLMLAIKMADVGHSYLPWKLHRAWGKRLEEEFFTQGRHYIAAGMEAPMLMDPSKPGVTEPVNQIAFFNVIALPMLSAWAGVFQSSGRALLSHAESNMSAWQGLARGCAGVETLRHASSRSAKNPDAVGRIWSLPAVVVMSSPALSPVEPSTRRGDTAVNNGASVSDEEQDGGITRSSKSNIDHALPPLPHTGWPAPPAPAPR